MYKKQKKTGNKLPYEISERNLIYVGVYMCE